MRDERRSGSGRGGETRELLLLLPTTRSGWFQLQASGDSKFSRIAILGMRTGLSRREDQAQLLHLQPLKN